MKKVLMMFFVSVAMMFSASAAFSQEKDFDASKYDNLYNDYIIGKIWRLNYELSNTSLRMPEFSIKIVPIESRKTGAFYRRDAYIRGTKMGTSKYLEVKKNSVDDGFPYVVYDSVQDRPIERAKVDEKGRLVLKMRNDEVLVFNEEALRDNGCRTYESTMDCMKRIDPKEYLRMKNEQFRKKSEAANRSQ